MLTRLVTLIFYENKGIIYRPPFMKQSISWAVQPQGAFFWDYSGIGILGIDGSCVLLGAIPFSE